MLPGVTPPTPVPPRASAPVRIARRLARTARTRVDGALLLAQGRDAGGRSLVAIGDSHSVLLVDGAMPSPQVVRSTPSTTVLYLGPRLMHSVGRDGLPAWVHRLLRRRRRSPLARGGLTAALLFGEIDLRCHLAKPGRGGDDSLAELVSGFLARATGLLEELGPDGRVVIVGPNPPSSTYESDEGYPVVGDVDVRAEILDRLCAALAGAVHAVGDPRLRFLDVRPDVADERGHLRPELTFDGCHLNAAGSALVRQRLAELDAS